VKLVLDVVCIIVEIRGGIKDKHTRSSCSTDESRSRFLFLTLVSAENQCSQRYNVKSGNNVFIAISVIIGYSVLIKIQNRKSLIIDVIIHRLATSKVRLDFIL